MPSSPTLTVRVSTDDRSLTAVSDGRAAMLLAFGKHVHCGGLDPREDSASMAIQFEGDGVPPESPSPNRSADDSYRSFATRWELRPRLAARRVLFCPPSNPLLADRRKDGT